MKKLHKIVMLASNKALIHLSHNKLITSIEETGVSDTYKSIPQHLYVLSTEPIKEKECFFDKEDNCIMRSVDKQNADSINETRELYDIERYYKIIATTNRELYLLCDGKYAKNECVYLIPNIEQQFIEHFISEYNKGNVLSEVEVEYISKFLGDDYRRGGEPTDVLKVDEHNNITISIPPIKMYSREKVKKLCMDALMHGYNGLPGNLTPVQGMNKWIEEHF